MSLKSKYSPPYTVKLLDEQTLTFKRMLSEEWEGLCDQMKSELVDAEAAKINTEMKDAPAPDRAMSRARMRDYFEQEVTMSRTIRDSSNTAKGIRRLLAFSLVEKDLAEWLDLITPADSNLIIDQIVYMPIVKPENPTLLPSQSEASSDGSVPESPNLTGDAMPPISNPSSPELTPAS